MAELDAGDALDGYTLSSANIHGLLESFVPGLPSLEFHSPLVTSRHHSFPLGSYLGKIAGRRTSRIVTPHSLKAKLTWLKY
jgi:hypothetical protein